MIYSGEAWRDFIHIDVSLQYCELAERRLEGVARCLF